MSLNMCPATECYIWDTVHPIASASKPINVKSPRLHNDLPLETILILSHQNTKTIYQPNENKDLKKMLAITCMVSRYFKLVKDTIRLPPPMMFCLRKFRFTIMPIQIRIKCIVTFSNDCSAKETIHSVKNGIKTAHVYTLFAQMLPSLYKQSCQVLYILTGCPKVNILTLVRMILTDHVLNSADNRSGLRQGIRAHAFELNMDKISEMELPFNWPFENCNKILYKPVGLYKSQWFELNH